MTATNSAASTPLHDPPDSATRDARRRIEDALSELGAERVRLEDARSANELKVSRVLADAIEHGLTVADITRLTGLSAETVRARILKLMQPIPEAHKGLGDPPPDDVCSAVLRVMGEQPAREWNAYDVRAAMPGRWINGTPHELQLELSFLADSRQIWRTANADRVLPPDDIAE
jgi:hypothetical protein